MSTDNRTFDQLYHAYPDEPLAENFVRRANHASLVLDNYVWIDGGEITMLVDGKPVTMLNNDTLTLDMSKSWTNTTPPFGSVNSSIGLNGGFIFPASDNQSFFQFGGEVNWLFSAWLAPEVTISQFTINGSGNGSWAGFSPGPDSGFNTINRPSRALASTMDDTFFIVGGYSSSHTQYSTQSTIALGDNVKLPGIVAFNMTTGLWTNTSSPSHLDRPNGSNGFLNSVPIFGPVGLLLAAGTGTVNTTSQINAPDTFENITIYEPYGKTWHYQNATGDIPVGRDGSCTVGIQGDNGTYEVFMYGGRLVGGGASGELTAAQKAYVQDLDAVYVLSLPAFRWFRADYPARNPRFYHTCGIVGNRQMLSIGGRDPLVTDTLSQDPAMHGLQIFDLTEMQWSNQYDAKAARYSTPQVVKDWYKDGNMSLVKWQDPQVREFFASSVAFPTGNSSSGNNTPNPSPPASPNSDSNHSKSNHTGAIAGGVVGGVAAVCLLSALVFWLLRLRRRRTRLGPVHQDRKELSEKPVDRQAEEMDEGRRSELNGRQRPWEADGNPRMELDARGHVGRSEGWER